MLRRSPRRSHPWGREVAELPTHLAPAKLTTQLRITGLRGDGYHLLEAEMVSIDLADELDFGAGDSLELVDERPRPRTALSLGEDNLVRRALAAVGRRARVRLTKRIPAGAGLGGGSADAAAVLRWAGCGDLELAARLGADVPFCLLGGRAAVRGVGEEVEPLPFEPAAYTLLTPPFGCSTVAVYRAWDRLEGPSGPGVNDLEPAALAVEPRLAVWRDRLAAASGHRPQLAGSGSTWFVPGHHEGPGHVLVETTPPVPARS